MPRGPLIAKIHVENESYLSDKGETMLQQDMRTPARANAGTAFAGTLARLDPRAALRRAWAANRSLTLLGVLMFGTLAASLIGLLFDPRLISGVPAWLKPFKFSVSIAIYSFTLIWMLGFIEGRRWLVGAISVVTLLGFVVEMVAIIVQVARGTISHFNAATPFDEMLFSIMGMMIVIIWVMNLIAAVLLLFQRLRDPAFAWALRLGLFISLLGAASGFLMTRPTPTQLAALEADKPVAAIGAHSVGVEDGGPAMPITGWSTTGGDLRIGHFVGLHALQFMPIVGWLLTRRRMRRYGDGHRVALVWLAALGYLGLMALTIWQALRGQPLLAPDGATLAALAGLAAATMVPVALVLAHGQRHAAGSDAEVA